MPVWPLVPSTKASPRLIVPRFAERPIIAMAERSLTEPAGLSPRAWRERCWTFFPEGASASPAGCRRPYLRSSCRSARDCDPCFYDISWRGVSAAGRVSLFEQLAAVAADALLDRKERRAVACASQRADVGLSEILVLAFQRIRKGRVLDQTLAARLRQVDALIAHCIAAAVDRGERHVVEALRPPRADVENARQIGVVEKMQVDLDGVLDRDEVAALLAVPLS